MRRADHRGPEATTRRHSLPWIVAAGTLVTAAVVAATWPVFSPFTRGIYVGPEFIDEPWLRLLANVPPGHLAGASSDATVWATFGAADTLRSVWTLAWWSHALLHAPGAWYDGNTLYPLPGSLTYADLQLGVVPFFAPTYWLTGDPLIAYRVALLASAVACGLFSFVLVRGWTASVTAGLVAGVATAVAPFHCQSLNLAYLFSIPYLPAGLLALDALIAGRRRVLAATGLVVAVVLQSSQSAYLAYACFLMLPTYAAVALLEERPTGWLRTGSWMLGAFGLAAGLTALLYRPYFSLLTEGVLQGTSDELSNGPLTVTWGLHRTNIAAHTVLAVGMPLMVLAAFGLCDTRSRRRWTVLAVTLLGLVLALGPSARIGPITVNHLPWDWLRWAVPGFGAQRHAIMTLTICGLGLCYLAGLGTGWLVERARARSAWGVVAAALIAAAVWVDRAPIGDAPLLPVTSNRAVPDPYRWLAEHGEGAPMIELPTQLAANAVYAYYSTYHWLPLFNGTFSVPPAGYLDRNKRAGDVLDPAAAPAFLREVPVTWVLVHPGLYRQDLRAALQTPPSHLELVKGSADYLLYRVRRP